MSSCSFDLLSTYAAPTCSVVSVSNINVMNKISLILVGLALLPRLIASLPLRGNEIVIS